MPPTHTTNATTARQRLLQDRLVHPINEQRARLAIFGERLDRVARIAIAQQLAIRVQTDRRLAPALGDLFRMALRQT